TPGEDEFNNVYDNRVVFEGYIDSPSLQATPTSVGYNLNLQHWTRDLALGTLYMWYALPNQANQPNIPGIYSLSESGQAGYNDTEGIPSRLGLPKSWRETLLDDLWENGQKQVLKNLVVQK